MITAAIVFIATYAIIGIQLAGNLTLIGSVADLIVIEAAKDEANISFLEYLKGGPPLTIIAVVVGAVILSL